MTVSVTLRPLRADDADAVAALWQAAWRSTHAPLLPPELDRARDDVWYFTKARGFGGTGLLALAGGAAVGFVTWEGAQVTRLFVAPDAPRVGAGSTLLAAAEYDLAAAGVTNAELSCLVGNDGVRRFYERKGWAVVRTSESVITEPPPGGWRVEFWRMEKAL